MSSNSVQSLAERLAEKRALTQQQLSEHESNLLRESQRGLDGIRSATDSVRTVADQLLTNMSDARTKIAETTAAETTRYSETLKASTAEAARVVASQASTLDQELAVSMGVAKASMRRLVSVSMIPLALVWALALVGVLAALGSAWWASRELAEVQALRASRASLEAFQGVQMVNLGGKPYLAAKSLGQPVRLTDGRAAIAVNPE